MFDEDDGPIPSINQCFAYRVWHNGSMELLLLLYFSYVRFDSVLCLHAFSFETSAGPFVVSPFGYYDFLLFPDNWPIKCVFRNRTKA